MRGPDLKPRKLRPAPVRDGLRPSIALPKNVYARRSRARALLAGKCLACYLPRGEKGTNQYCRACADKHAARERQRRSPEGRREVELHHASPIAYPERVLRTVRCPAV